MKAIWNPSMFQGWGKKSPYFEGWYFKLITPDKENAIAVIPGISFSADGSHAFIQTMDGIKKTSRYEKFDFNTFSSETDRFAVSIGENQFSLAGINLNLPDLKGAVKLVNPVIYPGTFLSPGIMGWYSFVPFMQCYHGLVSLHHRLEGRLICNGAEIDFTGGKGYIEKDWGSSFPLAWVWTQCNHYESDDDLSIMASVAHIPWMGSYFIGFLAVVYWNHQIKVFTTYTKAKMQLHLDSEQVTLTFRDRESQLTIRARQQEGTDLISPQKGAMTGKVNESLQASHHVSFTISGATIQADGCMAGLEVGGNSRILMDQK